MLDELIYFDTSIEQSLRLTSIPATSNSPDFQPYVLQRKSLHASIVPNINENFNSTKKFACTCTFTTLYIYRKVNLFWCRPSYRIGRSKSCSIFCYTSFLFGSVVTDDQTGSRSLYSL